MKFIKGLLLALLLLIIGVVAYVRLAVHEGKPTIVEGANAEQMAEKMLTAINKSAWDTLPIIQWTFRESHHYTWDKVANDALIKWEDFAVHMDLDEIQGKVMKNGQELQGEEKTEAIQTAWGYWCNDSFWLYAPAKIMDKGTTRQVAKDKSGEEGLLITYESGGVTPGDQYLWLMDERGLPTGYKMWTQIIPIGGVYASFENWVDLPGGAMVAADHLTNLGGMSINLTNVKGGTTWADLGLSSNPIKL